MKYFFILVLVFFSSDGELKNRWGLMKLYSVENHFLCLRVWIKFWILISNWYYRWKPIEWYPFFRRPYMINLIFKRLKEGECKNRKSSYFTSYNIKNSKKYVDLMKTQNYSNDSFWFFLGIVRPVVATVCSIPIERFAWQFDLMPCWNRWCIRLFVPNMKAMILSIICRNS
jgi:hypothetical protein